MDERQALSEFMFSIYKLVYIIDLIHDTYRSIKHEGIDPQDRYDDEGQYSYFHRKYNSQYVDERYQQLRGQVGSLYYLRRKFAKHDTISCDFLMVNGEGRRVVFKRYEMADAIPTKAIMFSYTLDEGWTQHLKHNRQIQDEYWIIRSLCEGFSFIFVADDGGERLDLYRSVGVAPQLVEYVRTHNYEDARDYFVENYVCEEDRERFRRETDFSAVVERLRTRDKLVIYCRTLPGLHSKDCTSYSKFIFCAPLDGGTRIVFAAEDVTPE